MKVKRLDYCLYSASSKGENRHPQDVLESMGVSYQHATPQSICDQWWFWMPSNLPEELPSFMAISYKNPMKSIGNGLTKKTAKQLRDNQ